MSKGPKDLPNHGIVDFYDLFDDDVLSGLHDLVLLDVQLGQFIDEINHILQRQHLRLVLELSHNLQIGLSLVDLDIFAFLCHFITAIGLAYDLDDF